ncbi:MAG: 4-hydroxy-2-oxoheptanedioate aldolase [Gaiellales bacterium]|nr:4-hydroxy-2-oxoheptanedioate aldolase [Gaiellales bacterium]
MLRASWKEGRETVGTWCSLPSPGAVETVAQSGFDWVVVDWQHGQFGGESLGILIQVASLAGAVPLVRVPLNEPWMIQKALDLGAHGIIVPLVNTRDEAERAAAACRYPPLGVRSFGPIRAARAVGWEPDQANAEVVCIVQIETAESLENVEQIAAVPGVDALFVGPADLAISLGLGLGSPELEPRLGPVMDAAARHGLAVGRHCDDADGARAAFASGVLFVAVGGDTEFLGSASAAAAADSRTKPAGARPPFADTVTRMLVSSAPPVPE